jgi:hypothetical protein
MKAIKGAAKRLRKPIPMLRTAKRKSECDKEISKSMTQKILKLSKLSNHLMQKNIEPMI